MSCVDVAYPFLLKAYADYAAARLSADQLLQLARTVESYVFRRAICNLPTNSLAKTFLRLVRLVDSEHYLTSVQAAAARAVLPRLPVGRRVSR